MSVQTINSKDVVFEYGDQGSLFYVILEGEVGVKVPTETKLKLTDHQFVDYIVNNYEDILF